MESVGRKLEPSMDLLIDPSFPRPNRECLRANSSRGVCNPKTLAGFGRRFARDSPVKQHE